MNRLAATALASGLAIAFYLATRPYGDQAGTPSAEVDAFASPWWVASHLAGATGLLLASALAWMASAHATTTAAHITRWAAPVGTLLVLPYYGAEAFALHAIARTDPAATATLADAVRNGPAALTTFGAGLIALAIAGVALTVAWWQNQGSSDIRRWGALPLGLALALMLPQYYLPATGRITYGVAFLVAAAVFAWAARSDSAPAPAPRPSLSGAPSA